jgi:AbrB family looped-hinge helix DNA binding protein
MPMRPGVGLTPGGLPWRAVGAPLAPDSFLSDLVAWPSGFAAVERAEGDIDEDGPLSIWSSPDGSAWVRSDPPPGVIEILGLVPQGPDLVLASLRDRSDRDGVTVDLWRSADGVDWRPSGTFARRLPRRDRDDWDLHVVGPVVVDDRLLLWTMTKHHENGSGGRSPGGIVIAQRGAFAVRGSRPPERIRAWLSETGEHWTGRPVTGARDAAGNVSMSIADAGPHGLLAVREAEPATIRVSEDGLAWSHLTDLPPDWEPSGGSTLRWVNDALLVLADSRAQAGGVDCGNRLGAWRQEPGTVDWALVADRQAALGYTSAVDGDLVIVTGRSWCTAPTWGWILVSVDGGRTWHPTLSWTGASGTCVHDVEIRDHVAVMEGCVEGGPSLWRAEVASVGAAPGGRPLPDEGDEPAAESPHCGDAEYDATMEETIAQLSDRGTITLPAGLRRKLGLRRGDVLAVRLSGRSIVLTPAVVTSVELYTDERIAEFDRNAELTAEEAEQARASWLEDAGRTR